ncbi:MAG: hypothetical protein FWE35_10965 [Streptosporangiales bacterium]|nr:hypothetical protein [Streptosporangiales bacterium]
MIDPKTEETFRSLTGHAIHNRESDMAREITEAGQSVAEQVMTLAVQAAAYVVIESAERWPTAADLKSAARVVAKKSNVAEDDALSYLEDVVFGSGAQAGHPMTPLYVLAGLVTGYRHPQSGDWNDWLDLIELGIEEADAMRKETLPAAAYRLFRK